MFRFKDQDGDVATYDRYDFPDLLAAIEEAKRVLGEMALDGLPGHHGEAISVQVLNSDGVAVARVGLTLSVEFPKS